MRPSPDALHVAFAIALAAFVVTGVAVAQTEDITVTIGDTLDPTSIIVAPGDTVTWVNNDDTPHSIVGADPSFRASSLDTNHRYSHRFVKPGVYPYYTEYPHVDGTVIVTQR